MKIFKKRNKAKSSEAVPGTIWLIQFLIVLTTLLPINVFSSYLTFHPLYFGVGSARLSVNFKNELIRVAEILKQNPKVTLKIETFAGSNESKKFDAKTLSALRAENIKNHLVKKLKIPAKRISILAQGTKGLINPKSNKAAENVRSEYIFRDPNAAAQAGQEIEVLYWNTLYHSLYQIGVSQGFFKEEGFKMKLIATNHSKINQVNAVCGIEPFLKERVTIFTGAVCGGSPHRAAALGVPLVVIGGMLSGGSMLVALPEKAALLKKDWKNFKGITIGRPHGTILTSMMIRDALIKRGIDPIKEVQWKEYGSHEEVIEAIAKKEIDAGDTYAPLNLRAKKQYNIVEVYNTVQLFPFHPCCRVITTKNKLKEKRPSYVRFMKALIKSHEYFVKRPTDSFKIIQQYTGYSKEEVVTSLTSPSLQLNPDPLKNGFVKFSTMMEDTGFLKKKVDINAFIDVSIYQDAIESLSKAHPKNPYYKYMMRQFKQQNF